MNPSTNETPGMNLPPPMAEQPAPAGFEPVPARPEMSPAPAQQMPLPQQPSMPQPAMPGPQIPQLAAPTTQQGVVSKTTQSVVASVVDDGDLIEKEWVEKAKKIVADNRDDPFKQSEELTVVRAEYLQQQYNKTIKMSK